MYSGDTYLDVYGYVDKDEPSVGHVGGIEIEDVRIAESEISVLEMIQALNWEKFNDQAQLNYSERNDK
jgi:hypothetical protein